MARNHASADRPGRYRRPGRRQQPAGNRRIAGWPKRR
ncbi:hypothetical protein RHECNPAF_890050 [Rhizobium etli CNPAF512]|nr:hypothetical protein RHECNPAF_890050 [Rhizobium etli CNPAF512]